MIERYYIKGRALAEKNELEDAITTFLMGLGRGECKCAYGLLHALTHNCSYTMSEEEGISIFGSYYPQIKSLAQAGDTEAMFMVAEGIRLGFVEGEDEPYLFWLEKAASLGDPYAQDLLRELEETDDPLGVPDLSECLLEGGADETDLLLLMQGAEDVELPQERVLLDEPDFVLREQFGINDRLKRKEMCYELMKCLDTTVLDEKEANTEFLEEEDEE
jgi:hypothetical protein